MTSPKAGLWLAIIALCLSFVSASSLASTDVLNQWKGENDSLDSIGTNHGTVRGNVSYVEGRDGSAFSFDGSGFLEIESIDGFSASDFTFDLWVQAELSRWFQIPILNIYHNRGDTSVSITQDGGLCVRVEWRPGGCTFGTGTGLFKTGEMAHLTIVKAGDQMRLYKNGVRVGSGGASCCSQLNSPIYFGGRLTTQRGERVILDEIRYHAQPLSDEAVFAMYSDLVLSNPDEELLADLEAAYALIESLEQEVAALTTANTDLEYQIITLENQNTVYIDQIADLEMQLDAMATRVNELEASVDSLEIQIDGLEQQVEVLQAQISDLRNLLANLESQIRYLEIRVNSLQAELDTLKETLNISFERLEADFRVEFRDPYFVVPGSSSEEKLENLIDAIISLKKGHKKHLHKALREDKKKPKGKKDKDKDKDKGKGKDKDR